MTRSPAELLRMGGDTTAVTWILLTTLVVAFLPACRPAAPDPDYVPPHTPETALETFELAPGFEIDLFAAEPMIRDPVAMEVDEDGRVYVVEMRGYPLNTEPIGSIRLLQDNDGDGRPDESRVFADGLVLPAGVMRWKKGILVTAAPDLLYLEDTDGDGRADVRRVVLSGFAFSNPQHTVNSPVYGLDNWIYLAHEGASGAVIFKEKFGDMGGRIHYPGRPDDESLEESRYSIRLKPETGQIENLSAASQHGHTFDAWGRYFTLNSVVHVRHAVIAARYLRRNPDLHLRTVMHQASDHGANARVFPITRNPRYEMLTEAGEFTSACGLSHYLGGGFGKELDHLSLVAEPVHNLVHADLWSESGSTFVASRMAEEREFLASTDSWFRPVSFYNAPDGSLYVLDYYREMIEHPEWTSARYHQDSEDLYRGTREGRIYRIFPKGARPTAPRLRLSQTPSAELVPLLGHPNVWWRRTAQRLLVDREARETKASLVELLETSPHALGRLHALWTLEGLGMLEPDAVLTALSDDHAGVRENAVILSERFLSGSAPVRRRMLELGTDASARVRFQVLLSAGYLSTPEARSVRDRLLLEDVTDPWVPIAALSSSSQEAGRLLDLVLSSRLPGEESEGSRVLFQTLASILGARQSESEISGLLTRILEPAGFDWWKAELLSGLLRGTRASASTVLSTPELKRQVLQLYLEGEDEVKSVALELVELAGLPEGKVARAALDEAAAVAADTSLPPQLRARSVRFLGLSRKVEFLPLYAQLLSPSTPEATRVAAIQALEPVGDRSTWERLIRDWRSFTPPLREAAATLLLGAPESTRVLLDGLEEGLVSSWSLTFRQKRALMMHSDPDVRNRGRALLDEPDKVRQKVLENYQAALSREGDAFRGQEVYRRECAKCHRIQGEGEHVGPDLETVRTRPAAILLRDILMPSESIAPEYQSYVVERISGGIEEGIIKEQTPHALILVLEAAREVVIPRDDIRRFYAADVSAMPGDLETLVSVEEMAHLLRFLKTR